MHSMSLSFSQIEFIKEQQALVLAARDNTNIQLAKDQLQAIFDNLPVGEQFPFKDFHLMNTFKVLSEFRDIVITINNIPGRPPKIPRALLQNWPVSLIPGSSRT